jgi:chemotaxis protein methyltransferase CheR
MYFSPKQARKVLENLARALVEGGWLIVSPTETSILRFSPLTVVNFPEATVYRKDSEGARQPETGATHPAIQPATHFPEQLPAKPSLPVRDQLPPGSGWPPPIVAVMPDSAPESEGGGDSGQKSPAARIEEMVRFARNFADQGDLAAALSWCEEAVAADRLNPAWHYLKAAILQEQDAMTEAILSLRKAIYLDQDFIMAHFALGNLALRQADKRAARKHFHNVLALLEAIQPEEPLPESEGITAGRLKEIVHSTMTMRKLGEPHAAAG